jgi:hypothetical protein
LTDVPKVESAPAVECLRKAHAALAPCSRPALDVDARSTREQLSAALAEIVGAAELFGCQRSFWRWAADAAEFLGRSAAAEVYRGRFENEGKG